MVINDWLRSKARNTRYCRLQQLKLTYAGVIVHLYMAKLVVCVNMSAIFRPLRLRTKV
jgi:hypothetical protein